MIAKSRVLVKLRTNDVTGFTLKPAALPHHPLMARVIPFPKTYRQAAFREPTLREILVSRGIEPTGEERRRKAREHAARQRAAESLGKPHDFTP